MKDYLWKAWEIALDAVDWAAGLVQRHPRKTLLVIAALALKAVL